MNKKYCFAHTVWPKMLIKTMLLGSIFIPTKRRKRNYSKEIHKTIGRIRISWSFCKHWTRLLCGNNVFVSLFLSRKKLISRSIVCFFGGFFVFWYFPKYILTEPKQYWPWSLESQWNFFSWLKQVKDSESWGAYLLTYKTEKAHNENFSSEILSEMI